MPQRSDPQDARVVAVCERCGGEIYAGGAVKRIDDAGGYVHDDYGRDCAEKYAMERVYDASGTINDNGELAH
jgi:hypothetical protein